MMFSSNPFAQFASSIHVFPPNSFLDNEKDDLYINHHHNLNNHNNPFVSGECYLHPYSPSRAAENFITSKQNSGSFEELGLEQCNNDEHNYVLGTSELCPTKKKKTSKKDHHSKIHTAQGPRDRRVRLSIDVARKFFYLQDLLGFDKASKTLDWLFNKSKIPIDELIQGKKHSSSSTLTDESELVFLETVNEQDTRQKKKSAPRCESVKRKKLKRKYKSEVPVNQSRAEARARARERTKEKLHIKKLGDESKKVQGDACCCCCPGSPSYLKLQSSFWSANEWQNGYNDRFGESLMEEKISLLHSYQQNLDVSNDSSSINFTGLPKFSVTRAESEFE